MARKRADSGGESSGQVLTGLPVLWAVRGREQAIGIHVDEHEVWAGWTSGDVVVYDHAGRLKRRWRLPDGVDAVIADEAWRYAGCHDGKVYDLTGRTPRVAYELESGARIHWMEVHGGKLCASDAAGALTVLDADCELLWRHAPRGVHAGWMVRADASGVYLGNSGGISKLSWSGRRQWMTRTPPIGFGWQDAARVYGIAGYDMPHRSAVVALDKATGEVLARGSCSSREEHYDIDINAAACAAGPDGVFYGAICETLFCFDARGRRLWETPTHVGSPCSMAYRAGRLYIVTHTGHLAALDVSDEAVARAGAGRWKQGRIAKLSEVAVTSHKLETTARAGAGVVVECVREAGKVRVRVVSPGYHPEWFCQFPRDIREVGARYVVDEVRESSQGGFYRVLGEIRRLTGAGGSAGRSAAVKQTTAKKVRKKATAKKAATKETTERAAKKSTGKKSSAKKTAAKKATAKKSTERVAKKSTAKKSSAKSTAKRSAAKKTTERVAKKATGKKSSAKRSTVKRTTERVATKSTAKKATGKRSAAKKSAAK